MRRVGARHVLLAAALAAGAHAAAAVIALSGLAPRSWGPGDAAQAGAGLTIALATPGGAAAGALTDAGADWRTPVADAAPEALTALTPETLAAAAPPVIAGAPVAAATAAPVAEATATPVAQAAAVPVAQATAVPVAQATATPVAPAIVQPAARAIPSPVARKPRVPDAQPAPVQPAPIPSAQSRAAEAAQAAAPGSPDDSAAASAPTAAQGGDAQDSDAVAAGETPGAPGGDPAAVARYAAEVQRLLARHKRYPAQARARRIEGAGVLAFAVGADGAVRAARVARSAGHPLLDAEIVAMLRRAGKLPPPPQGQPLKLTAPVTFRLQ